MMGDIWEAEQKRRLALQAKLRPKMEAEFGTAGHPKADNLWKIAWQAGYEDFDGSKMDDGAVRDYYEMLVDLIL